MTEPDEKIEAVEGEDDGLEVEYVRPDWLTLSDPEGQVAIDPDDELWQDYGGWMYRDGSLFGFHRERRRWENVERSEVSNSPTRKLRPVQN